MSTDMLSPKEGPGKSGKITPTHNISEELKVHHSCSPEAQTEGNKQPQRGKQQQSTDVLSTLKRVSERFSLWDSKPTTSDESLSPDSSVSGYYSGVLTVDPAFDNDSRRGGECSPPVRDTGASMPLVLATSTPIHLVPPPPISQPANEEDTSPTLYLANVRLTEQVGILTRETEQLLQDKTNLVCRVDSLKTELELTSDGSNRVDSLRRDLQDVIESRGRMELELAKLQTNLDASFMERNHLQDGLNSSKSAKLLSEKQLGQLRESINSKEEVIINLKNKIVELYTEMNIIKVSKESFEQDRKRLQTELESIQRSQVWYKEQLKSTQEARNKLQLEVTKLHEILSQGAGLNEELTHENSVVRLKLSKMEQYVLEEKRTLAAELEVVRSEMIEREAIFEQILMERNALEEMISQKQQEVHESSLRMDLFSSKVGCLEEEINQLNSTQTAKLEQLELVEVEKSELAKKLFCLQESVSQKDGVFEEQCMRYNDLADKLRKLDDSCREKSDLIDQLVEDKSALEVNLSSSKREKDALDKYMANLKGDMVIVEESFRKLRYDLDTSSRELASVTSAKADLSQELLTVKAGLDDKLAVITRLSEEKQEAEVQFRVLHEENRGLHADRERFQKALEASELKVAQLESDLLNEQDEKNTTIANLKESRSEVAELKASMRQVRSDVERLSEVQSKYLLLLDDHQLMTEKYEALAKDHRELIERYRLDTEKLKQEIVDTRVSNDQALEIKQVELNNYQEQLHQLEQDKLTLEQTIEEVKAEHSRTLEERMALFRSRLQSVSADLVHVREDREQCRTLALEMQNCVVDLHKDYQDKLNTCFEQMHLLNERIVYFQGCESQNRDLSVELEKARGRALGLETSLDQIKQHSGTLENSLGRREASLLELEKTSGEKMTDISHEKDAAMARLVALEEQVREADAGRILLKENMSLLEEKYDLTKSEVEKLRDERDQLLKTCTSGDELNTELNDRLTSAETECNQACQKLEEISTERAVLLAESLRLETQWRESETRENAVKTELDVSRASIEQTRSEIDELKRQLKVLENKHVEEMEEADVKIKTSDEDRKSLNTELSAVREEKLRFQRQLAHLRGSLRAAIQRYRLFSPTSEDGDNPPVIDVEHLEKLLLDSNNMPEAKPTRSLNRCLDRLYNEMSGLRERMTEHTGTVHASFDSWKNLEAKALELQNCCDEGKTITPHDQPEHP